MSARLIPLLIAAAVISGAANAANLDLASTPARVAPPVAAHVSNDLASLVYLAAQTLAERAEGLDKTRPIVVTTMVSVDDLNRSSTFGRLASELVANRMEQRGLLVRDITYMRALTLRPDTGELALSREASKVSASIDAQAVVVGSYAVAGRSIYLSLRLLSADSGEVISSADVAIPLDANTRPLIDAQAGGFESFDRFQKDR